LAHVTFYVTAWPQYRVEYAHTHTYDCVHTATKNTLENISNIRIQHIAAKNEFNDDILRNTSQFQLP